MAIILTLAATSLLMAFFSAFALTVAYKWDIIPWLQSRAPNDIVWKLFNCNFCMSFWLGLATSVVLALAMHCGWFLLTPVFSAKLSAKLME